MNLDPDIKIEHVKEALKDFVKTVRATTQYIQDSIKTKETSFYQRVVGNVNAQITGIKEKQGLLEPKGSIFERINQARLKIKGEGNEHKLKTSKDRIDSINKKVESFFKSIKEFPEKIKAFLKGVGTGIFTFFKFLSAPLFVFAHIIKSTVSVFYILFNWLTKGVSIIKDLFEIQLIKNIPSYFNKLLANLAGLFSPGKLIKTLFAIVGVSGLSFAGNSSGLFYWIFSQAKIAIGSVFSFGWIKTLFSWVGSSIMFFVQPVLDWIKNTVFAPGTYLGSTVTVLSKMWPVFALAFKQTYVIVGKIFPILKLLSSSFALLSRIGFAVVGVALFAIKTILSGVFSVLEGIFSAIGSIVSDIASAIGEVIKTVISTSLKIIKAIFELGQQLNNIYKFSTLNKTSYRKTKALGFAYGQIGTGNGDEQATNDISALSQKLALDPAITRAYLQWLGVNPDDNKGAQRDTADIVIDIISKIREKLYSGQYGTGFPYDSGAQAAVKLQLAHLGLGGDPRVYENKDIPSLYKQGLLAASSKTDAQLPGVHEVSTKIELLKLKIASSVNSIVGVLYSKSVTFFDWIAQKLADPKNQKKMEEITKSIENIPDKLQDIVNHFPETVDKLNIFLQKLQTTAMTYVDTVVIPSIKRIVGAFIYMWDNVVTTLTQSVTEFFHVTIPWPIRKYLGIKDLTSEEKADLSATASERRAMGISVPGTSAWLSSQYPDNKDLQEIVRLGTRYDESANKNGPTLRNPKGGIGVLDLNALKKQHPDIQHGIENFKSMLVFGEANYKDPYAVVNYSASLQGRRDYDIERMTLDEIVALQHRHRMGAAGKYQGIESTLRAFIGSRFGGIEGGTIYTPEIQEKFFAWIISRKKNITNLMKEYADHPGADIEKYAYAISASAAREWASISDVTKARDYMSHYPGKHNKALISKNYIMEISRQLLMAVRESATPHTYKYNEGAVHQDVAGLLDKYSTELPAVSVRLKVELTEEAKKLVHMKAEKTASYDRGMINLRRSTAQTGIK